MTFSRLIWLNLRHHWRGNLAVALGVAVGTAVLAGALVVGDSLRGSLRDLALRRLGWVDQSLASGRFFRTALAEDLQQAGGAERVAPVLLLQGNIRTSGTGQTARKVTVLGIDGRFLPEGANWLAPPDSDIVHLNAPLARALGVRDGDGVLLQLQRESAIPRETLLGQRQASDVVETDLSFTVRVLPADAPGSQFSLTPSPEAPRNAFVPLRRLQEKLDLGERVNALLVGNPAADLQARLNRVLTLADWELEIKEPPRQTTTLRSFRPDYLSLQSRRMVLEPAVVRAVEAARLRAAPTLIYVANNIADLPRLAAAPAAFFWPDTLPLGRAFTAYYGPSQVFYSAVAAIDLQAPGSLEAKLREALEKAGQKPRLRDDQIILPAWRGSPIQAQPGQKVALTYFRPEVAGRYEETTRVFTVAAVVPVDPGGALADPNLVQEVPGVTDKQTPPFPYDETRKRESDDLAWARYRTMPKAYVSLKVGQQLWKSRFGDVTTYRLVPVPGGAEELAGQLLPHLDPKAGGFIFDPVKAQALEASSGGTDFAMLFLAFSFFLILSALLLVGLLFRLNLERRASEVGLLLATGVTRGGIRRLLLGEGAAVAVLGGLLGLGLAVCYGDLLLGRLRAWWPGGLDESILSLHVTPRSLGTGYVSALAVSLLTIAWAARSLAQVSPRSLIAGRASDEDMSGLERPSWSKRVAAAALVGGLGCLVAGNLVKNAEARAGTFFGGGVLLLTAGIAALLAWMKSDRRRGVRGHGPVAVVRLGVRNASRHPARSLLTAGLLASAAFLLVGVEAFRRQPGQDYLRKDSGSGGFALLGESDLPVYQDLNSDRARQEMLDRLVQPLLQGRKPEQLSDTERWAIEKKRRDAAELLGLIHFCSFRVRAGDDASCLNLYQPRRPRVVGVPESLIREGGFAFSKMQTRAENPWTLLETSAGEAIPAFGEQNTVVWMLKSGLGKNIPVLDSTGQERPLKITGLLHDSVFQSSLLVSERRFLDLYPGHQGYTLFLVRVPAERIQEARQLLGEALADYGFEATPTAERLEAYLAVENMYLSTFQALGGLGLLLGTLGLAVVLLRGVWERQAELALLRSLGYRRQTLGLLVLAENASLLLLGLGLGALAALASVAPHVLASGMQVNWLGLAGTLALVLAVGLVSALLAVLATLRTDLIPALRRE